MIEINDYVKFYVDVNAGFESRLFNLLIEAYKLGAKKKKLVDLSWVDSDCDWIEFEGSVKGRELAIDLKNIINECLKEHDKEVADLTIAKYKQEHNIQD